MFLDLSHLKIPSQIRSLIEAGKDEQAAALVLAEREEPRRDILRELARELAREVGNDRVRVRGIPRALDLKLELARAGTLASALASVIDNDLTTAIEHSSALSRHLEHAGKLSDELDSDVPFTRLQMLATVIYRTLYSLTSEPGHTIHLGGAEFLSPLVLSRHVSPYLQALFDFQEVIARVVHQPYFQPEIKMISYHGSIRISLNGAVEAARLIIKYVEPWRRMHSNHIAQLAFGTAYLNQRVADEQLNKIQTQELPLLHEDSFLLDEKSLETQHLRIELQREQQALERDRIELYTGILDSLNMPLTEVDRLFYLLQLKPPLDILCGSVLSLDDDVV